MIKFSKQTNHLNQYKKERFLISDTGPFSVLAQTGSNGPSYTGGVQILLVDQ